MTFLTILGLTETLCSFKLVLEEKTGKEISESSTLEFLEKFSANNSALSDAKGNTSEPLLLAICQKSRKPSFWKGIDSFVLLAYASLANSRTLLQRLLVCLNVALESKDLSFWYERKK